MTDRKLSEEMRGLINTIESWRYPLHKYRLFDWADRVASLERELDDAQ